MRSYRLHYNLPTILKLTFNFGFPFLLSVIFMFLFFKRDCTLFNNKRYIMWCHFNVIRRISLIPENTLLDLYTSVQKLRTAQNEALLEFSLSLLILVGS